MRNSILVLIAIVVLQSCNEKSGPWKSEFPYIIVEQSLDSLMVGDVFEARIYLSDSSYLYVPDESRGKGRKVFPVFKVNGIEMRSKSDYFIVRDTADNLVVYPEYPFYREIECSIIFPHPKFGEGSVELQKLVTYIVSE